MQTLSQISRRCENLPRARAFFGLLGVVELYAFPGLAFFDLGATRLMLQETGTPESADILYFNVLDIAETYQTLHEKGITCTQAPKMIHRHPDGTEEWMAFFADDEGRPLALHSLAS